MSVISHDILGIRNDGAIDELVVIRIRLNQPETELGIHANNVVRPKNDLVSRTMRRDTLTLRKAYEDAVPQVQTFSHRREFRLHTGDQARPEAVH